MSQCERTHCYALSREGMQRLYDWWSKPVTGHCDWRLGDWQAEPDVYAYKPETFLAYQRANFSTIRYQQEEMRSWDLSAQKEYECCILFIYHRDDAVTLQNLESIQRHNPDFPVIPLCHGTSARLPGAVCVDDLPSRWDNTDKYLSTDSVVYRWFESCSVQAKRYVVLEWDTYCSMPLQKFFGDRWDDAAVANTYFSLNEWPDWCFFQLPPQRPQGTAAISDIPQAWREHAGFISPFSVFMLSRRVLQAVVGMKMPECLQNEFRLGTAVVLSGFKWTTYDRDKQGYKQARNRNRTVSWMEKNIMFEPDGAGVFHPVKHLVPSVSPISLFVNVYPGQRMEEVLEAMQNNCNNQHIGRIYAMIEGNAQRIDSRKITYVSTHRRPTFQNYFDLMCAYAPRGINIVANSDIYFNATLELVRNVDLCGKCLALLRWNESDRGLTLQTYDGKPMTNSHDAWIFQGCPQLNSKADFFLGQGGCDWKLGRLLVAAGYALENPALDIQAVHHHGGTARQRNTPELGGPAFHLPPTGLIRG